MESILLDAIVGQPTLNSVRHLSEHLTTFASHFATTKWGVKHGLLPLILRKAKICLAAGDNSLDCERLDKPELLNPKIEDGTKGHELLQLQEDQKVEWQYYTFQELVDSMLVKATVAAVDVQYVEDLEEDYVGYKNQTIKMMVMQL